MNQLKQLAGPTQSLTTQMILSFIAVALLTAVAASIPEFWLVRNQIDRQIWAQLEAGRRATRALYASWQTEAASAALLTAQLRPLQELTQQADPGQLASYLAAVQDSLDLELVQVCDATGRPLAQVGQIDRLPVCGLAEPVGYHVLDDGERPSIWLIARQTILPVEEGLGTVVVGIQLGAAFVDQMQAETGLQHTLLIGDRPVVTSIDGGVAAWSAAQPGPPGGPIDADVERRTFITGGAPYYAARLPLIGDAAYDEVAFPASELVAAEQILLRAKLASALAALFLGGLLGLLMARRIGTPLVQLSQSAARMSQGDLTTDIPTSAGIREVTLLAQALQRARIDLRETLAQLRAEKAWVDHLLEAIVEGIITLDDDDRITFVSPGATRITGWRPDELIGQHCDTVIRPAETTTPFSELIPSAGQRRSIWVTLAGDRTAALSFTRAVLAPPEAGAARMALVFRDISHEEAVHRLLGGFLANITHEFRTPLTALAASVELMIDQATALTTAELHQMLDWLRLGILGLQTLVDNLLESASLEAGRFRISTHPTDLGELIAEATGLMQPLIEKYDQHLTVDMPTTIPIVVADSRRIVQVLVNLLSNANKYSPDGSEITISVGVEQSQVRIGVADQGPGIAAKHVGDLFHRFAQVDGDGDKKSYGVGLGLWVVKAVVESHGGQVGYERRPEGGSQFWFTLPVAEDA